MTQEEIKNLIDEKQALIDSKTDEVETAIENKDVELAQKLMEEIKALQSEIEELKAQEEVERVEETDVEEERAETNEEVESTDVEPAEEVEEVKENQEDVIEDLKAQIDELKNKNTQDEGEKRNMTKLVEETVVMDNTNEVRDAFATYIATGEKREGLTTESGAVIVPTEIANQVADYSDDVSALSNLVQVKNVSNGQGEVAFFDGTSMPALPAVKELEENPQLGIQAIKKADFKVETYRGYFPVSKESIEDGVGALELVKSLLKEAEVATENKLILDVLNKKDAVEVTSADALKKILNVDLAPKYKKAIVLSQSAYNAIDTMKDGNGRYLFQDSITAQSGKQLFGMPVAVFEDELIGEGVAYVGDLAGAVGLIKRSRYEAQWTSYMQFAECLMIAVRLDAIELNPKAVVKVNLNVAPTV